MAVLARGRAFDFQGPVRFQDVAGCVEIIAAMNRHRHAIEQASRRWRGGTRRKILISTQALAKVDEATDPAQPLSKEDFVDDLALTSMARLWDVGKSEPIKVGKASPTEGTLPGAVYFIVKYDNLAAAARANAEVGGDSASRAVAIGAVLGAAGGLGAIPPELGAGKLVEWDRALALLDRMPLLRDDDSGEL